MPVLKATAGFSGIALLDGDPYYTSNLNWGSTNVFFRQIRNLVFDMTSVPANVAQNGIHWPTSQATSLQNVVFQMSSAANTQHVGLFCESGKFHLLKASMSLRVSPDLLLQVDFRYSTREQAGALWFNHSFSALD